jgi:hypothetical protein
MTDAVGLQVRCHHPVRLCGDVSPGNEHWKPGIAVQNDDLLASSLVLGRGVSQVGVMGVLVVRQDLPELERATQVLRSVWACRDSLRGEITLREKASRAPW